jgi:hypothetical protein
MQIC